MLPWQLEGEAFLYGIQHAIENKTPFLCFSSGGGMRMMESLISLSQMTRTTLAINELKKNNLPYLVCLTDPTAGGNYSILCYARRNSYMQNQIMH